MNQSAIFKKLCFYILIPICTLASYAGLQQLIETQTRGFCLQKIFAPDLSYHPEWEVAPLAPHEQQHIQHTLNQPYFLIGSGSECFVFQSEDQSTVIKFFKLDHARPVYFIKGLFKENYSDYAATLSQHPLTKLSLPSPFNTWLKRLLGIREFRITRTFSSLKIAYEELQRETGIFYLHLNPTDHIQQTITLIDANGYRHLVDLDTTPFLLQHSAIPLETHLKSLIDQEKFDEAQAAIDSIFELILNRCQKGFADRDFINRNLGYIGNRAIEIDMGSFIKDPSMKKPWSYKKELFFATLELREWLQEHSPELHTYSEERLNDIVTHS